jgi:hypothetical protein
MGNSWESKWQVASGEFLVFHQVPLSSYDFHLSWCDSLMGNFGNKKRPSGGG